MKRTTKNMATKKMVMGMAISSTMAGRSRMRSPLSENITMSVNSRPRIDIALRPGLSRSMAASPPRRTTNMRVSTPATKGRPR